MYIRVKEIEKDTHDKTEHQCAHHYPGHPWDVGERHKDTKQALVCSLISCASTGVEGTRKKDYETWASSGVLVHVLHVYGSRNDKKKRYTGHRRTTGVACLCPVHSWDWDVQGI